MGITTCHVWFVLLLLLLLLPPLPLAAATDTDATPEGPEPKAGHVEIRAPEDCEKSNMPHLQAAPEWEKRTRAMVAEPALHQDT